MLNNLRQTLTRQAEPCPKAESGAEPTKASEWAKEILGFHAEKKQAEVLDNTSKYLIL